MFSIKKTIVALAALVSATASADYYGPMFSCPNVDDPTTGPNACLIPTYNGIQFADGTVQTTAGGGGGGSGTVTSVGLALPSSIFNISGSPVHTTGTLTGTFKSQVRNTIFAGPIASPSGVPTFRALDVADMPFSVGNLTDAGTDGITISGGINAVMGSGSAISQHVADATHNGYLSSDDWNRFETGTLPGGSANDVQFNNGSGAFGGSSNFTFDGTNASLTNILYLGYLHTGGVVFPDGDGGLIQDYSNFVWDNTNKRLGVGQANPQAKLHVSNGGVQIGDPGNDQSLTFGGTSSGIYWASSGASINYSAGDLLISSVGFPSAVDIQATTGYVGIGTTSPAYKLDVSGSARITDTLNLPDVGSGVFLITDSSSNVIGQSGSAVTPLLSVFDSSNQGVVPGSGGGSVNFLRADGNWAAPTAAANNVVDIFSGNASTVAFTITKAVTTANSMVYISGIYQSKANYSISGTTITFSSAPPRGTNNVEVNEL